MSSDLFDINTNVFSFKESETDLCMDKLVMWLNFICFMIG